MTTVPELLAAEPLLAAALTLAILAVVGWSHTMTYTEFRLAHLAKCYLFDALDAVARRRLSRPLVHVKRGRDYVRTVGHDPRRVAQYLHDRDATPHLVATAKAREVEGRRQWAHTQWVWFHDDGSQTEAYLFRDDDGATDVYAHHETAVTDPDGHLTDGQTHGDPRGVVRDAVRDLGE